MSTMNAGLSQLHELHLKLQDVQGDLDRGPRQIAAKQQTLAKKQAELKAKHDELKQARMAADQKGLQQKTNEAKLRDLQAKLNAAATNREFEILKNQIAADTVANSVLDDEILEALDRIDKTQVAIKACEAEVVAAEESLKQIQAVVAAADPDLQKRKGELVAQVGAAEKLLPPESVPTYRRLVATHGAGALSRVDGKACTECYMSLTHQMVLELKAGALMFCKSCGRLMYIAE